MADSSRHPSRRPPTCQGCGYPLKPHDEVRVLQRELAHAPMGDEVSFPVVAYAHLGDEPRWGYRITGRARMRELLANLEPDAL